MDRQEQIYSAKIFLNSVLPLFRVLAEEKAFAGAFAGKSGCIQISVKHDGESWGTHFLLDGGKMETKLGVRPSDSQIDVELAFKDLTHFNDFFKGSSKKLPAIKGFTKPGLLVPTFRVLLKMSSLLSAKTAPADEATKALMVKLFLYLLSSGISQLNRCRHPEIYNWSSVSPDRVFAWQVDAYPEIAAYLRVKAGQSRAGRGAYTRSAPFFTMRFADLDSALAILLQTGDLLGLTMEKKLMMEGAPEFGAQIGDAMMLVARYAQA